MHLNDFIFLRNRIVLLLHHNNNKNFKIMKTKDFITTELKRREELVMDIEFRKLVAKHAENIGITSKEWNENKMPILLYFANEFCSIENKINK
jgi:hypothetical protein